MYFKYQRASLLCGEIPVFVAKHAQRVGWKRSLVCCTGTYVCTGAVWLTFTTVRTLPARAAGQVEDGCTFAVPSPCSVQFGATTVQVVCARGYAS